MKRLTVVAAVFGLTSLISLAAQAEPVYQVDVVPGTSTVGEFIMRLNVATGQSVFSGGDRPTLPVTEAGPLPGGEYHLRSWATINTQANSRTWNVIRYDAQSGRMWHLASDGATNATWIEILAH